MVRPFQEAQSAWEKQFSQREVPDEMPEIQIEGAPSVAELLKLAFGVSGNEARRMVEQGAVQIDGEKQSDPTQTAPLCDGAVIKMGKRKWARVRL